MKHLAEEEVVVSAPVTPSHVVDAHIGDSPRLEQVFHLGQQGTAGTVGIAAPLLGGGLLHVPHGGPVLDGLDPAQRVEPRVLQIEVGVGKGLVQVFIRGLDVEILELLAVEFLDLIQLGGGVKGSQLHGLLPVIGEAQHDPRLALRGIALREGAAFFSVMHGEGHIALHAGHHAASLVASIAADDDGRTVLGEGSGAVFTVNVLSSHMLVGGEVHEGQPAVSKAEEDTGGLADDMEHRTAPQAILLGEANGVQLTGNGVTVHDRAAEESAGHIVGGGGLVAGLIGQKLAIFSNTHHHLTEQNVVSALMVFVIVGHQRHVGVGLPHEDHAVAIGGCALVL